MLCLILVVIFTVAASCDNSGIPLLRVVGGRDALPDEYTFVVRIENTKILTQNSERLISTATGSIITPIWVLTCAHCIQGDVKNYRLRYGDMSNYADMTRIRNAVKLMVYPGYRKGTVGIQNDIGLVMVEAVPVDKLARLSMIEYTSLVGLPVKYAGYGYQTFDKLDITLPLQVGDGGVIPCDKELAESRPAPAICVAAKCNDLFRFVFFGDSGGPLFYDGQIIGIAAYVVKHKRERRITLQMFTPISPFIDWIQSVIFS